MNWDQIEGKWKHAKGTVREQWGKLTDDDLEQIGGKKDKLIGKLQERYGVQREEAEKQLDRWIDSVGPSQPTARALQTQAPIVHLAAIARALSPKSARQGETQATTS